MSIRNDAKWNVITDEKRLIKINTPSLGSRHLPVNHGKVLNMFRKHLKNRIENEQGLLSPDNMKYIYHVEISSKIGDKDYKFCLGFINYNNRHKAFTIIAGEKVMVCSNEMFTGELQSLSKRHTPNIEDEIENTIINGIEYSNKFFEKRRLLIDFMKNRKVLEPELGLVVLKLHKNPYTSSTFIDNTIKEFYNPTFKYEGVKNSLWNLQNAFTHINKYGYNEDRRIVKQKEFDKILCESFNDYGLLNKEKIDE